MSRKTKLDEFKEVLAEEASRVVEDCTYSAKGNFEAARIWNNRHLMLGVPSIVMAAASGVSSIASHYYLGASLAFMVSALTALSTFLKPEKRSATYDKFGNEYLSLRNRARIFQNIQLQETDNKELLLLRLNELSEARNSLNSSGPQIPSRAFRIAKHAIEVEKQATYAVDQ